MNSTTIPYRILSINVGRSSTAQEIALNIACDSNIDVLLIQEPYIFRDISRKITKKHPAFECFSPTDNWSVRPRVLTYTRKDSNCTFLQERPSTLREVGKGDLLFLSLQPPRGTGVTIVNVYNAPPGAIEPGSAVDYLVSQTQFPNKNTILAGDFNLHYSDWQPSYHGTPSPQAQALTNWLSAKQLTLISEIDVPTHNRGNVLDLCFASYQLVADGITSSVQMQLGVTSDHLPILISVPGSPKRLPPARKPRVGTLDEKTFLELLKSQIQDIDTPVQRETAQIEHRARTLVKNLQMSLAGSARHSLPHNKGQPWWDFACKEAKRNFREASRHGTPSLADKKAFRKVVKKAKSNFYRKKLEEISSAKDAFEVSKWHKSKGQFRTPPLVDPLRSENEPAQTPEEKRDVILRNLLSNNTQTEDIPNRVPTVAHVSLPFPKFNEFEITEAILRVRSTTPGRDGISTALLRIAWPLISDIILDLFQACSEVGYHPHCFRTAVLAIIEKPNKVDRSSPRSYRPIALLSVLGKGLERLIAKRMSWIAIKYKVLASQQFGALPLRSSVDLTTCLTHDVEAALAKGWTASVATLDIKGAFDTVLPGRLEHRLREQGWPSQLCDWVSSFTNERKVCIRLDGEVGPIQRIQCGLPQGSPVSPILFMLYVSPLFKLDKMTKSFGYADDVAILKASPSLEENSRRIGDAVNQALSWGINEGITFDPGKSELLHFSRKRRDKDKNPSVNTNEFVISVNQKNPYLKWLGIHFDRKLSFKQHVSIQASKALKATNALRCFGSTVRGIPPRISKQVISACVLPIAHYGAPTWWPGKTKEKGNRTICNRVGTHLNILDKVHRATARAILPVYCTTPSVILYRESGITTAELALENLSRRAAIRTRRLDPLHPLNIRSCRATSMASDTRFTRAIKKIPMSEQIDPLSDPPWLSSNPNSRLTTNILDFRGPTTRRASIFQNFISNLPKSDIMAYTDGSKSADGKAGTGFVIFQMSRQVASGACPLGANKEPEDIEAHGVLRGIRAVLTLPTIRFASNLWLFTDNQKVVKSLSKNTTLKSSKKVYEEIIEANTLWKNRERLPHTHDGEIKIVWIPSHSGIEGNELADIQAKKGAAISYQDDQPEHSFASLESLHAKYIQDARKDWWNKYIPESYSKLGITNAPSSPKELHLSRKALGRLISLRTGHGDFASYHLRFGHTEANLQCHCGSQKTQRHLFFCRILRRRGHRPTGSINYLIPKLLGTPEGATTLTKWLESTNFFEHICTR